MTLVPIDPSSEVAVISFLESGVAALSEALDHTDIAGVVNIKAQAATVETATKQLGLSKESQDCATELVRRSEWTLGRAIRRGQAEGQIASDHGGDRRSSTASELDRPTTYAGKRELYGSDENRPGIYALAEIDEPDFDAALTEAKTEGNLSRANVARKAREKSGARPSVKPRPEAEKSLNTIAVHAAKAAREADLLTPDQIRRIKPKADLWTVGLRDSIEALQRLVNSLNN